MLKYIQRIICCHLWSEEKVDWSTRWYKECEKCGKQKPLSDIEKQQIKLRKDILDRHIKLNEEIRRKKYALKEVAKKLGYEFVTDPNGIRSLKRIDEQKINGRK